MVEKEPNSRSTEYVTTKFFTKDQLPEVGEKVLVFFGDNEEDFDVAWICKHPDGSKKWTDGEMDYSIDSYTTWMPRPKPRAETEVKQNDFEKQDSGHKLYNFKEGIQMLFISQKEFFLLKERGKAKFISPYRNNDKIFFTEDCIRHFFDESDSDELVAKIKAMAYERWSMFIELSKNSSAIHPEWQKQQKEP